MNKDNVSKIKFEKRLYSLGILSPSEDKIFTLGEFLTDCFDFNEMITLLKTTTIDWYGANSAIAAIKDDIVTLSLEYQEDSPEFQFTLSKDILIHLLEDWVDIKKQDPQLVTLYWENDKYWFEIEK